MTPARTDTPTRTHGGIPCPNCGGKTRDGLLCGPCVNATRDRLQALPGWWVELQRTVTRQARLTAPGGARGTTTPLPFDPDASDVAARIRTGVTTEHGIRNGLTGWIRITVEDLGAPWPRRGVTDLCNHLEAWLPQLRRHQAAAELAADAWGWIDAIRSQIDYPDERARIKAGPCPEVDDEAEPCPGTVWAIIPQDCDQSAYAACDSCNGDERGLWPSLQWRRLGPRIEKRRAQIEAQKAWGA